MSTKHSKAAAQKRVRREQRSKDKRKSANRGVNSVGKKFAALSKNKDLLEQVVRDAKMGKGADKELMFKDDSEMIAGIKSAVGEVFKLYSYITLANHLIEKALINHTLSIDLKQVSVDLMAIDSRFSRLSLLAPEEMAVDVLEMATEIGNITELLYGEVMKLEEYSLTMEEVITTLSNEVEGDASVDSKRISVLSAIAYKYLHEVSIAQHTPAEVEQVTAVEVE